MATRAAAYIRVSTAGQVEEGSSLPEQRDTIAARVEAEGWELVEVYADEGVSGKSEDRRELQRLLADLPGLDRIVVTELSRLGRRAAGMLELFDRLEKEDVALVSIRQSIDTSTAAGRLLRNVLVSVAEFESEQLGERVRAVTRSKVSKGSHHGRAPYGYRSIDGELSIHDSESIVIRRIFRLFLAGEGIRQIARTLNDDDLRTRTNKRWTSSTIGALLRNPTFVGRVVINGDEFEGAHKAIIDKGTWERAVAMRATKTRSKKGGPGRLPSGHHLFTRGLLRCTQCGSAMTPRTFREPVKAGQPRVREAYLCAGHIEHGDEFCDLGPVPRQPIDAAALAYFEAAALDLDKMRVELDNAMRERRDLIVGQVADAEREAARAAERMKRVRTDYQDDKLDADDYREQYAELRDAQQAADAQLQLARTREAELVAAESEDDDPVDAAAERMQAIRDAVAAKVTDAEGINAVRSALGEMFDAFWLLKRSDDDDDRVSLPGEDEAAAKVRERVRLHFARLGSETISADDFVIAPLPKLAAVKGLDDALQPVLQRRGIDPATKGGNGFVR